jgi:hypothetical protein
LKRAIAPASAAKLRTQTSSTACRSASGEKSRLESVAMA